MEIENTTKACELLFYSVASSQALLNTVAVRHDIDGLNVLVDQSPTLAPSPSSPPLSSSLAAGATGTGAGDEVGVGNGDAADGEAGGRQRWKQRGRNKDAYAVSIERRPLYTRVLVDINEKYILTVSRTRTYLLHARRFKQSGEACSTTSTTFQTLTVFTSVTCWGTTELRTFRCPFLIY